jgi:hypothetical protein
MKINIILLCSLLFIACRENNKSTTDKYNNQITSQITQNKPLDLIETSIVRKNKNWNLIIKNISDEPIAVSKLIVSQHVYFLDHDQKTLSDEAYVTTLYPESVDHVILKPLQTHFYDLGDNVISMPNAINAKFEFRLGILSPKLKSYNLFEISLIEKL